MAISTSAYEWMATNLEAGCVTVIPDCGAEQAAVVFGIDRSEPLSVSGDRHPPSPSQPVALMAQSGHAQVVVEDNGYQGSRPDVLCAASTRSGNGKAASIFWSADGIVVFSCARKGKLLASVELLGLGEDDVAALPRMLRPYILLMEDEDVEIVALGAAMVDKFTGVRFYESSLEDSRSYLLAPVPVSMLTIVPETSLLSYDEPGLLDAIVALQPLEQRELAERVTTAAVREAGISETEGATSMIGQYGNGDPAEPTPAAFALAHVTERAQATAHQGVLLSGGLAAGTPLAVVFVDQRRWAAESLLRSTDRDPLSAALGCVDAARLVFSFTQLRRSVEFVEDAAGRRPVSGNPEWSGRERLFTAALRDAVARRDWAGLSSSLPAPLTDSQRNEAIAFDNAQEAQGRFGTWQFG